MLPQPKEESLTDPSASPSASSTSGSPRFLGAILVLGGVAYFLKDYLGFRYGFFGSLVWIFIFAATFFAGIAYHALFIIPAGVSDWYQEGLNLIWQHFFTGHESGSGTERDGVPPSIETLGAGVVDSHVVLSLAKGRSFSRPAGPGYIKIESGEGIRHVVDLRPHQRQQRLKAMTRDGIPLEALAVVAFRVRRPAEGEAAENEPFPYDKSAIFQVSYFSTIAESGGEIEWTDRVAPLAAGEFVSELSNYRLDELYPLEEGPDPQPVRSTPLERMVREVQQRISQRLQANGIELLHVQLIDIALPEDVTGQRIANLQSNWQQVTAQAQAQGDAEVIRQLEGARATAEVELIRQIVETIERLNVTNRDELSDIITIVTIEALEKAAMEDNLNLHPQILQTLSQVQSLADLPLPRPQLTAGSEDEDDEG